LLSANAHRFGIQRPAVYKETEIKHRFDNPTFGAEGVAYQDEYYRLLAPAGQVYLNLGKDQSRKRVKQKKHRSIISFVFSKIFKNLNKK